MARESDLLVLGLGGIVLAVGLLTALVARAVAPPTTAEMTVAALDRYRGAKPTPGRRAPGPNERLVAPLFAALRRLSLLLSPGGIRESLQRRLDIAGNPRGWTVERVLVGKGLGLVAVAALGASLGALVLGFSPMTTLAGAAAGFLLPDLLLYNSATKRQQEIQRGLADALDLLTVCVEAGLGFDAALGQVARNGRGPLAAEFVRLLQEMQIGKSRSAALRSLAERTTVAELKHVVAALVQADALGIPVAAVLREQAKEMRIKRRQLAEEKAQKVTIKILFPLFFCIFPALFVIIIGPGAISIMEAFGGG
jgi:tight adherence protein C